MPGSIAGTFGVALNDHSKSLVGWFGAYNEDRTRLPSSHGLSAKKLVMQPGDSVERGDVLFSCPEGDWPCIVTVEADGATSYDRNGEKPTLSPAYGIHWRDNPWAEDLLDHWNDPAQLRQALSLSAVNEADVANRTGAVKTLLESAGEGLAETGRKLRNVRPEELEIIGERDGITYGRWRGGPAGTMNLEFDWRFAQNFDTATRARMERGREVLVPANIV